jgi:hypothetical protein
MLHPDRILNDRLQALPGDAMIRHPPVGNDLPLSSTTGTAPPAIGERFKKQCERFRFRDLFPIFDTHHIKPAQKLP